MGGKRRIFGVIAVVLVILIGLAYYLLNRQPPPARVTLEFPEVVQQGQEFSVPLRISTDQVMNAAEFYFNFPANLLEIKSIDKSGSIYSLWIKEFPKFDNQSGQMSFAGGLPTPGFSGQSGLIANVVFVAKKSGSSEITLDQELSRVLANNGEGSEIESIFSPIDITVQ